MTRKTIGIIVLAVAIAGGGLYAAYLFLLLPEPDQGVQPVREQVTYPVSEGLNSPVYLFFSDREGRLLAQEQQAIIRPESPVEFAKVIIGLLIKGSQTGLGRVIPEQTALRALYLDSDGTAYADFSKEVGEKQPGGVHDEYMTVAAVVSSLTQNIPQIRRVKFLVEGKEAETLGGHVNITSPFAAGMMPVR